LKRALIALCAVAVGLLMLSELTARRRKAEREIREYLRGSERMVDYGVKLRVVAGDPAGQELIWGMPTLLVIREHDFGGMFDTVKGEYVGPSQNPQIWYASVDQEQILIASNTDAGIRILVTGSEGAGKTRTQAMWHGLRVLEHLGEGRTGGQTAPTDQRLEFVRIEFSGLFPEAWCKHFVADDVYVFPDGTRRGTRIQLVSTYKQSRAGGSPLQGFSFSWLGRDEGQDQVRIHADAESRGRRARGGGKFYRQLITATNKDDTEWRDLRDLLRRNGRWLEFQLSIFRSPFITREFIEEKKLSMDEREFLRRYGDPVTGIIPDLPVELAVYHGWLRARNLLPRLPRMAPDVTAAILRDYQSYTSQGARFTLLCCHDPGNIWNTTEVLRLHVFFEEQLGPDGKILRDPQGRIVMTLTATWVVVGEYQSKQTTAEQHALELLRYLQQNFHVERRQIDRAGKEIVSRPDPESPKAIIFCDPHGKGEAATDYGTVYAAFQKFGLDVFNPSPLVGKIKRKPRVDTVNRLMNPPRPLAEIGKPAPPQPPARLVILVGADGFPVAKKLVEAFEYLQKQPGDDNPEGTHRKDENDKTHAPAALGYGVWPFEQLALTERTQRIAIEAAARLRV
jgi:hypothetical protein